VFPFQKIGVQHRFSACCSASRDDPDQAFRGLRDNHENDTSRDRANANEAISGGWLCLTNVHFLAMPASAVTVTTWLDAELHAATAHR
jgi:hypothetical protein